MMGVKSAIPALPGADVRFVPEPDEVEKGYGLMDTGT